MDTCNATYATVNSWYLLMVCYCLIDHTFIAVLFELNTPLPIVYREECTLTAN